MDFDCTQYSNEEFDLIEKLAHLYINSKTITDKQHPGVRYNIDNLETVCRYCQSRFTFDSVNQCVSILDAIDSFGRVIPDSQKLLKASVRTKINSLMSRLK